MPAAMGVFYLFIFFLLETKERVRKSRGKQAISVRATATEVLLYFEICPCLSAFQDCLQVKINRIYHRSPMQAEKSLPDGKRRMPETRFTEFPEFSVDSRVEISRCASENDV